MPNDLYLTVRNAAAVDRALANLGATLSPNGKLRDAITLATGMAHRYAAGIVHVVSGRLKNSLFDDVETRGNSIFGRVGTNVEYAPYEHARGGEHAFFTRTAREEGPAINDLFATEIRSYVR